MIWNTVQIISGFTAVQSQKKMKPNKFWLWHPIVNLELDYQIKLIMLWYKIWDLVKESAYFCNELYMFV